MKKTDIAERIYEAVIGMYANKADYVVEGIAVDDEFESGKECDKNYEIVYNAKNRLHEILSDSAYDDVEVIHQRLNQITHDVAIKMFVYGVKFGSKK